MIPSDMNRDDFGLDIPVSPDIELISDYLAKELPQEQVAEVRRRLETDAAFKDLAAPLLAAWEIAPYWQRHPMSPETVAKHWDDFTRRAGFVHQRQKRRRRRWLIITAVVLAAILGLYSSFDKMAVKVAAELLFEPVADSGKQWVTLRNGARVRFYPGTDFRSAKDLPGGGILMTMLQSGGAHVEMDWKAVQGGQPLSGLLMNVDRATLATAGAKFSVELKPNTTFVNVIDRGRPTPDSTAEVVKIIDSKGRLYTVRAGQRARILNNDTAIVLGVATSRAAAPADSVRPNPKRTVPPIRVAERQPVVARDTTPAAPVDTIRVLAPPETVTIVTARIDTVKIDTVTAAPKPEPTIDTYHRPDIMPEIVSLRNGTEVYLGQGSTLRVTRTTPPGEYFIVELEGSAYFQMPSPTPQRLGGTKALGVRTLHATFLASSTNFSIRTTGDTVQLNVFEPDYPLEINGKRPPVSYVNMSGALNLLHIVQVKPDQRARSIAGNVPYILRGRPSKSESRP